MSDEQGSILDKIISTQQASSKEHFNPQGSLDNLLQCLNDRERQVIWRRFGLAGGESETLESIGKSLQVTRERIRQIERLAINKLKQGKKPQEIMQPIKQVVVDVLEGEGGAASVESLQDLLSELGEGVNKAVIKFYLDEVLSDLVVKIGGDDTPFVMGWRLRTASEEAITALVESAHDIISKRGVPILSEELARGLLAKKPTNPLGGEITESRVALGLLELSQTVSRNTFGEWGLKHWETITPKRMNDKIYLVLKKHGKPLHFREIAKLINEAKFDHKTAYPPTVHNELIMDKKYVLVGRGIYALKEWGFAPGVVADVLMHIIQDNGNPLTRDELVQRVLRQRVIKKGTIHLALTNRKRFTRLADGRYTLTSS